MGIRREKEEENKVEEEINSDDMKNSDESCNGMEWNINGWEVLLLIFPHEGTHSQGITTCDHLHSLSLSFEGENTPSFSLSILYTSSIVQEYFSILLF